MKEIATTLLVGLLVGLVAGWKAAGWSHDSENLAFVKAAEQIRDEARLRESTVAKEVLEQMAARAPAERVIDRGIIREIQKTEYRNVCFGDELVRLLNDGARGTPGAVPGKPASAVP